LRRNGSQNLDFQARRLPSAGSLEICVHLHRQADRLVWTFGLEAMKKFMGGLQTLVILGVSVGLLVFFRRYLYIALCALHTYPSIG
jgi:hypothetical protein